MPNEQRALKLFLRAYGVTELFALAGLLMPRSWMLVVHEALELGQLPARPTFFFLARIASLMYAVHGAITLFISFDVVRYARLITFIGVLLMLQGLAVMAAGVGESFPLWWALGDGCAVLACGAIVIALQTDRDRRP